MLIEEVLPESRMVWARRQGKLKRMYRCTSGHRKGRVVATPTQCFAPINIKSRQTLRKTKARMGSRLTRKARRTKRVDPVSRRLRALNIRRR